MTGPSHVILADRHLVEGDIVLHAREPDRRAGPGAGRGYRKFVDLELEDDGL